MSEVSMDVTVCTCPCCLADSSPLAESRKLKITDAALSSTLEATGSAENVRIFAPQSAHARMNSSGVGISAPSSRAAKVDDMGRRGKV